MTDRVTTWAGAIPQELDIMRNGKYAMIGIAKLAAAVLGTNTAINGLTAVPTSPATLTVNVNPGEIYSLVSVDATAQSSLAADTTHQILKSGILLDAFNLSCPAPGTAGQSINYLIEAIYQETDTDLTTLPYYNASNPTSAWSGPNNSGTPQATTRKGTVALVAKAGAAATTGSQTTPTPDAGYTGLWVVTVANGQSTITAGNITQYAGAPILPSSLLASIQNGNLSYAVATGTANAHTIALTPALQTRVDGMPIRYKAPAANTGAVTLNDGLGAVQVLGGNHAALQGGEYALNGDAFVVWNSTVSGGAYILEECTGGALQVASATASQHAAQFGQVSGVVGTVRNLKMSVSAASASATMTADEIVVESALGGLRYCLANFNKTVNLATTGAGGMDTGTAPVSGYVALYAIYNPTTSTAALLATNATSAAAPHIYGGANMPSGYTASALVSVWPTNGSSQFVQGGQRDRRISMVAAGGFTTATTQASFTSIAVAGIPMNAVRVLGNIQSLTNAANVSQTFIVASDANGAGAKANVSTTVLANNGTSMPVDLEVYTPQTLWYKATNGSGTPAFSLGASAYDI